MTVAETLTPEQTAFVALADHCHDCTDCRPDGEGPDEDRNCPTVKDLYRAWWVLFRARTSRTREVRS